MCTWPNVKPMKDHPKNVWPGVEAQQIVWKIRDPIAKLVSSQLRQVLKQVKPRKETSQEKWGYGEHEHFAKRSAPTMVTWNRPQETWAHSFDSNNNACGDWAEPSIAKPDACHRGSPCEKLHHSVSRACSRFQPIVASNFHSTGETNKESIANSKLLQWRIPRNGIKCVKRYSLVWLCRN